MRQPRFLASGLVLAVLAAALLAVPASAQAGKTCSRSTPVAQRPVLRYGDVGRCVRVAQLRLNDHDKLSSQYTTGNYLSITKRAVKRFQRSRDLRVTGTVNRATWRKLAKPVALPRFCRQPQKVLCIDKRDRKTRFVVNGIVRLTMDARFGDRRGPQFVTEEGRFRVYWKDRDHVSSIYDAPMPFSLFFNGGQAVHYSPDFNAVGYSGSSHGCVNSRDWGKMRYIFKHTPEGTPVLVY